MTATELWRGVQKAPGEHSLAPAPSALLSAAYSQARLLRIWGSRRGHWNVGWSIGHSPCRQGFENQGGRGRKSNITCIAKIVIAESAFKWGHSTKKLSSNLSQSVHPVSKSSVHCYLRSRLGPRPRKPQLQPRLSTKQKRRRLEFAKEHFSWTTEDCGWVIFSDQSAYQPHQPPSRPNHQGW